MTAEDYIRKLTLEEKAVLLQGATAWTTWSVPRLLLPAMRFAYGTHGLCRTDDPAARKTERATCFPATLANSFDPELAQEMGRAVAAEAAAAGVHALLLPELDGERPSQEPYLSGKMAAGYIRGIQENGVIACPRLTSPELPETDDRTLRERYLTATEIAVKEAAPKAMLAGGYGADARLLQEILRREWGFDGFVLSGWCAGKDPVSAIAAGEALTMPAPGLDNARYVAQAVRAGELSRQAVDDRLGELLPVVLNGVEAVAAAPKTFDEKAHHALAKKCAAESMVLLENDGFLPLSSEKKLAVIGVTDEDLRFQPSHVPQVSATGVDRLVQSLREAGVAVTCAPGFDRGEDKPDRGLLRQAVQAAQAADGVLLCLEKSAGALSAVELGLLRAVTRASEQVVLVLSGDGAVELPDCPRRAVIDIGLAGQAQGSALAEILLGRENPSGRLAQTWRRADGTVRYPFGYGLSYTSFVYSDLTADSRGVRFTLTNSGAMDGAEVVQVYVSSKLSKLSRPGRELKAFRKVILKAGQQQSVTIPFDDKAFRYFNSDTGSWEVETGHYAIEVAASSEDIRLSSTIRLIGSSAALPETPPTCAPTPPDTGAITMDAPLSRLAQVKNPLARQMVRGMEKKAGGLDISQLPLGAMPQLTGGRFSRDMTGDLIFWANGHFWRGGYRLLRSWLRKRKAESEFRKILDYGPEE